MLHAMRWTLHRPDPAGVAALVRGLDCPEFVASFLMRRGLAQPDAARLHMERSASQLHDPRLLPGMEAAMERLARAVRDKETILVHGDYDVDGVTGTALLMELFRAVGAKAVWHIPNRLVDGYSFGPHSVVRALEVGATVVVSVDNGTSAFETIAQLREHGIDTVVTDHHEPPPPDPVYGDLPPATAIVNPKLAGSLYPWRELCGGAVAFKLAWGLALALSDGNRARPELKAFLDECLAHVAIATVCDVVPLLDENRVFAHYGLRRLERTGLPGLRALLEVAGIDGRALTSEDVGFQIGPRINASGRLGSAQRAVELLLARDPVEARRLARELDGLNQERKRLEGDVVREAREQALQFEDPERYPVLVLAGPWHQGVVGIVAARLVDQYQRPALVIGLQGEEGRGSARSVHGFDVLAAMHGGSEHMARYGGHAQAAGCEVRADQVEALREAVCARAKELLAAAPAVERELVLDAELDYGDVNEALMRHLDRLAPFGSQHQKPLFVSKDLRLAQAPRAVGAEGRHLLVHLRRGATVYKAMAFHQGARIGELQPATPIHAAYTPKWNSFRGKTALELELVDFRVGPEPVL